MIKQASSTKRTTVYRMIEETTLESAIREKYRASDSNYTVESTKVDTLDALLVSGSISNESAWVKDLALLAGKKFA